jgi:5-oxoprolinase (ATP-hydrolysing) subunit C
VSQPPGAARAVLRIVRPGPCTTVQDLGRPGWGRFGVSPSGAMDPLAHRVANHLLGGDGGAPTLEITDAGAEIEVVATTVLALAGGDLGATLDGQPLSADRACVAVAKADRGARLRFVRRRHGARIYLAIPGGLDLPPLFGSAATDLGAGLGGLGGRPLRTGDQLCARPAPRPALHARRTGSPAPAVMAELARLILPDPGGQRGAGPPESVVRFVPAGDPLVAPALAQLPARAFTLSARSNRAGFRFEGQPLPASAAADRLSEPTAPGALQLPPDGLPILLMADGNPTGGYPLLGHLARVDRGLAAQLGPGARVRFSPIGGELAVQLYRQQEACLVAALAALSTGS